MDAPIADPRLPATERTPDKSSRFVEFFGLAVLGLNLLGLAVAWYDRSWFALAISLTLGPGINACLAIGGSVLAIRWRSRYPPGTLTRNLMASWCFPAMVAVLDYFLITSMGLQGC